MKKWKLIRQYHPHPLKIPVLEEVEGRKYKIGRDPATNDIVCPPPNKFEAYVSNNHCEISFSKGVWKLEDKSRNGTFLNENRVEGHRELREGDIIGVTLSSNFQCIAGNEFDGTGSAHYFFVFTQNYHPDCINRLKDQRSVSVKAEPTDISTEAGPDTSTEAGPDTSTEPEVIDIVDDDDEEEGQSSDSSIVVSLMKKLVPSPPRISPKKTNKLLPNSKKSHSNEEDKKKSKYSSSSTDSSDTEYESDGFQRKIVEDKRIKQPAPAETCSSANVDIKGKIIQIEDSTSEDSDDLHDIDSYGEVTTEDGTEDETVNPESLSTTQMMPRRRVIPISDSTDDEEEEPQPCSSKSAMAKHRTVPTKAPLEFYHCKNVPSKFNCSVQIAPLIDEKNGRLKIPKHFRRTLNAGSLENVAKYMEKISKKFKFYYVDDSTSKMLSKKELENRRIKEKRRDTRKILQRVVSDAEDELKDSDSSSSDSSNSRGSDHDTSSFIDDEDADLIEQDTEFKVRTNIRKKQKRQLRSNKNSKPSNSTNKPRHSDDNKDFQKKRKSKLPSTDKHKLSRTKKSKRDSSSDEDEEEQEDARSPSIECNKKGRRKRQRSHDVNSNKPAKNRRIRAKSMTSDTSDSETKALTSGSSPPQVKKQSQKRVYSLWSDDDSEFEDISKKVKKPKTGKQKQPVIEDPEEKGRESKRLKERERMKQKVLNTDVFKNRYAPPSTRSRTSKSPRRSPTPTRPQTTLPVNQNKASNDITCIPRYMKAREHSPDTSSVDVQESVSPVSVINISDEDEIYDNDDHADHDHGRIDDFDEERRLEDATNRIKQNRIKSNSARLLITPPTPYSVSKVQKRNNIAQPDRPDVSEMEAARALEEMRKEKLKQQAEEANRKRQAVEEQAASVTKTIRPRTAHVAGIKNTSKNRNLQLNEELLKGTFGPTKAATRATRVPTSTISNNEIPLLASTRNSNESKITPSASGLRTTKDVASSAHGLHKSEASAPLERRDVDVDVTAASTVLEIESIVSDKPQATVKPIPAHDRTLMFKKNVQPVTTPQNSISSRMGIGKAFVACPASKRLSVRGKGNIKPEQSLLDEDSVTRAVVKWNPAWIEEQQKNDKIPPIVDPDEWTIMNTLPKYNDYVHYIKVFYPLMLLELWESICSDLEKPPRRPDYGLRKYQAYIDSVIPQYNFQITRTSEFSKRKDKCGKPQSVPADPPFTNIKIHSYSDNRNDINTRTDLAIVTFFRHGGVQSSKFAFLAFNSEVAEDLTRNRNPIFHSATSDIHKRCRFRVSLQLVTRISSIDTIDKREPVQIQLVSQISTKLRDFKALASLNKSPLFKAIVTSNIKSSSIWSPKTQLPTNLVKYVEIGLNHLQKVVVSHVHQRLTKYPNEPEIMLLHGPPGTGKTRTIIGMVLQLLQDWSSSETKMKILLCTPSNTAINEIIRRLDKELLQLPMEYLMIRLGENDGVPHHLRKYFIDEVAAKSLEKQSSTTTITESMDIVKKRIDSKNKELAAMEASSTINKILKDSVINDIRKQEDTLKKFQRDLQKMTVDRHQLNKEKALMFAKADVVCSTLNSCANSLAKNVCKDTKTFTCCIVDEASQTTEPETLAPLLLNVDKLILVGDPHQLGPTVLSKTAAEKDYGLSLFTRLYEFYSTENSSKNPVMMLKEQYRMNKEILKWPNDYFYQGQLSLGCPRNPKKPFPITPYLFINLSRSRESNRSGAICNNEEVQLVSETVRNIWLTLKKSTGEWFANAKLGIITPYKQQKEAIENELYLKEQYLSAKEDIEVDTVDSFQGREKDIVVISCVRTASIGFLKEPKRLNVALTRAKHALIIIGDATFLSKDDMWNSLIADAKSRGKLWDIPKEYTKFNLLHRKLTTVSQ